MEEEVHIHGFFKGGLKGRNQLRRQVLDKTNRICQGHLKLICQMYLLGGGVQGGKEFIGLILLLVGHGIHDGGLASIGVTNQANLKNSRLDTALPNGSSIFLHGLQLALNIVNLVADTAAVEFQLAFTWTAGANSTGLTTEHDSLTNQAGQHVFELGQVDL